MLPLLLALTFVGDVFPAKAAAPTKVQAELTSPSSTAQRLVITRQSDVRLDGRPCRYEQVPANAVITFAEVGPDRQTVLRIHFRRP
jgi:hypothetical protein